MIPGTKVFKVLMWRGGGITKIFSNLNVSVVKKKTDPKICYSPCTYGCNFCVFFGTSIP